MTTVNIATDAYEHGEEMLGTAAEAIDAGVAQVQLQLHNQTLNGVTAIEMLQYSAKITHASGGPENIVTIVPFWSITSIAYPAPVES